MLTHLSSINHHPRDDRISFEEKTHTYTIDGDSTFTSVTTWVHSHFNKFDADAIIDKMMNNKNWGSSKYYGMTKDEIKLQWNNNGNQASTAGTKLHHDIECFYNLKPNVNDSIEYGYFNNFLNDFPKLKPFRTEWTVFDKECKLAGSIDMLFTDDDNNFYICDWKRTKQIKTSNRFEKCKHPELVDIPDCNFYHYTFQLNTYKYILEKNYNIKIDYLFLVCLHPDNKNSSYIKIDIPNIQDKIKKLLEYKMIPLSDTEFSKQSKIATLKSSLNISEKKLANITKKISIIKETLTALLNV